MRTLYYFIGFVVFALVLLFVIGEMALGLDWFNRFGGWAWLIAILLLISDIVIPIPATAIITSMGERYGPLLGGAIGTVGVFAAGIVAYSVARLMGRRFAVWLLQDDLKTAETFFQGSGSFAVACSRWLPIFPEAISCLAGLARMEVRAYCIALLCGALPMCYAYATLPVFFEEDSITPFVISVIVPVPIWWIAGRLLHLRARDSIS